MEILIKGRGAGKTYAACKWAYEQMRNGHNVTFVTNSPSEAKFALLKYFHSLPEYPGTSWKLGEDFVKINGRITFLNSNCHSNFVSMNASRGNVVLDDGELIENWQKFEPDFVTATSFAGLERKTYISHIKEEEEVTQCCCCKDTQPVEEEVEDNGLTKEERKLFSLGVNDLDTSQYLTSPDTTLARAELYFNAVKLLIGARSGILS